MIGLLAGGLLAPGKARAQDTVPPLASAAAPLIFRGVTVIDVTTGQRLADRTVMVVGNRIQSIKRTTQAQMPRGARVVNARGKYLIPGLWDLHVHPRLHTDIAYPLFLANGVTGVRDAGSEVPLATLVQWKREIAAGTRVGPRLVVSGPMIMGGDGGRLEPESESEPWHLYVPATLARYVVDSFKAAGTDFIKTYGMPDAMYFTMVAEARRVGLLVGGHLGAVPGLMAADSGVAILDHGPGVTSCSYLQLDSLFDATRCAAAAAHLRRQNSWVTLVVRNVSDEPSQRVWQRRYRPATAGWPWEGRAPQVVPPAVDSLALAAEPQSTAEWAKRDTSMFTPDERRWVAAMIKADIPIAMGTDVQILPNGSFGGIPGRVVPEILEHLVLEGMSPLAALQTATLNPALALRATDSLGTVEAGKLADLVMLDADPLSDIWNTTRVRAIVANGHYYDRTALLAMAEHAARRHDRDQPARP